jgi:Protein of unknown function (DUF4238)
MEYKPVRRPHVVPRGYLRSFAVDDWIVMHRVGETTGGEIPVSKAGVLKEFYRRHRPDGTPIYDFEWSLEHIERPAPKILREIAERWPLSLEEKAILAEFIGIQLVRGARWRAWHAAFTQAYFADLRADPEIAKTYSVQDVAETEAILTSDTEALMKMLAISRKTTAIFGSMQWALVEFKRPWLATSDHPVVLWPVAARSRQPMKSADFVEGGLLNTLEVRFPISPVYGLLMTWLDDPDDEAPLLSGTKDIAGNVNAFTIAEVEHQRFSMPGSRVPISSGQLLPIAPRLLRRNYSDVVALASRRRDETSRRIQSKVSGPEMRELPEFELVTVTSSKTAD